MCWECSHQLQATFAAFTVNVFLWAAGVTTPACASASTEPLPCSFREGNAPEAPTQGFGWRRGLFPAQQQVWCWQWEV